jgi:hypothetical protein
VPVQCLLFFRVLEMVLSCGGWSVCCSTVVAALSGAALCCMQLLRHCSSAGAQDGLLLGV